MLAVFKGVEKSFEKLHTAAVIIYCNILLLRIPNECVSSLDLLSHITSQYKVALLHGTGRSFVHFTPPENLCPAEHMVGLREGLRGSLRSLVAFLMCWTGTVEDSE